MGTLFFPTDERLETPPGRALPVHLPTVCLFVFLQCRLCLFLYYWVCLFGLDHKVNKILQAELVDCMTRQVM